MLTPEKTVIFIVTALLLAACTAAGGGEVSGNLSNTDQEGGSPIETDMTIKQVGDETPESGGAALRQIQTATFALG